ncbi:BlaI/MecI/CopY family transcriptional regulator [Actinocrispum wychmicini]|uniref:Putative transcriptional regulator n=1 Tax=Actinocrispum wychmicini TaxID=1213861 RepID=A0A4R2JR39_9PSEU|nr:BlaI/MecI/CopY family transcriptional regulator [Actinocrispum wychmicini]TCO59289.1 putative transcriptional regulator [Actinocrispum wychmicini]
MPRRVIAGRPVGELEAEVLRRLWTISAPVTGKQLQAQFADRALAYTTLMTVLARLVGKGLVERVPDGRVMRFRAAGDPDELTAQAIGQLLASARDPRAVLAHLVEDIDDPALAADLAAILDRARRT